MITIATYNIQNKYKYSKYDGLLKDKNHINMLMEFINRNKIDIIGLQEVNPFYANNLLNSLDNKYHYYGKYRFGNINRIKLIAKYNEATPIITKYNILKEKTIHLPLGKIPRILSMVELDNNIVIINTHLDHNSMMGRKKQLKKILKIVKNISKPLILMGDFNLTIKNDYFSEFVDTLEKLNIKRVKVDEKTLNTSNMKNAIDHVFISSDFSLVKAYVENNEDNKDMSDHFPIIVKLNLGFSKK